MFTVAGGGGRDVLEPVTVTVASRRGRDRAGNQDRWAVLTGDDLLLLAVADGMGGTRGGGAAASSAVRVVADLVGRPEEATPAGRTHPVRRARGLGCGNAAGRRAAVPADPAARSHRELLDRAVAAAHARVVETAPADVPVSLRPGTTLTAAVAVGRSVHIAHAGDSSAWLVRRGALCRLTDVHTFAAALLAAGAVAADSAAARRLDHLLTRYVGMPGPLTPQQRTVRLRPGDRLLIASDGVTRAVPVPELAALLARPDSTAGTLVAAAVSAGALDDATAVLATLGGYAALPEPGAGGT